MIPMLGSWFGSPMLVADGWGHMGGFGGMPVFGWVFMVLFLALLAWAVWALVSRGPEPARRERNRALELLDERYARGEIDGDEYRRRKAELER